MGRTVAAVLRCGEGDLTVDGGIWFVVVVASKSFADTSLSHCSACVLCC